MNKKSNKSPKWNISTLIIIFIIAVFFVKFIENDTSTSSNESNIISTDNQEKWIEDYQQIESEDMITKGEIIYTLDGNDYVETMEVLDIVENVELESGYISKKAMEVKYYEDNEEVIWKDIDSTIETSLSDYGIKYFIKVKKYNP